MNIGIIILYSGERLLQKCLDSVKDQCKNIIIVSNISPYHNAINECFRLGVKNFDWFIVLDADTTLKENVLESYQEIMEDNLWCITGRLEDYYHKEGRDGTMMYNSKVIGDFKHTDDPNTDRTIHGIFHEKGYSKKKIEEYVGVHHPEWTCEEAFKRHFYLGTRIDDMMEWSERLGFLFREDGRDVNKAALLGLYTGFYQHKRPLNSKDDSDWDKFNNNEILKW